MTSDTTSTPARAPMGGGLDRELNALRDKAGRICDELADLYRRMDELHQQIEAHQQR